MRTCLRVTAQPAGRGLRLGAGGSTGVGGEGSRPTEHEVRAPGAVVVRISPGSPGTVALEQILS